MTKNKKNPVTLALASSQIDRTKAVLKRNLTFALFLSLSFILLALASCAVNPVSGRQEFVLMSETDEMKAGRQGDQEVKKEYHLYDDKALQAYVNEIGQKLAKTSHRNNLEYHFTVLDSDEINAFALPGGYVYISRGIVAYLNSEAELAAVLGHEIGHVNARHSVEQFTAAQTANIGLTLGSILIPALGNQASQSLANILGHVLLSGYGREHELEADRLGAEYLARSNYNPQAMINVIGVLKNQEELERVVAKEENREPRTYHGVFSSHPDNDARLKEVVNAAQKFAGNYPAENKERFQQLTNNLIYGDNVDQGIVRGTAFYHPELDFSIRFPDRWLINNLPDRIQAKSPDGQTVMQLSTVDKNKKGNPSQALQQLLSVTAREIETLKIDGNNAALATAKRKNTFVRAAVIEHDGQRFFLFGASEKADAFDRFLPEINKTINSFHRLTSADKIQAKPLRMKYITAKADTTFAKLADNAPLGRHSEILLRIINAKYPTGEPKKGERIKIVE